MGILHRQGAVGSASGGVAAVWHCARVSDTSRQEREISIICDWMDWAGHRVEETRGARSEGGDVTVNYKRGWCRRSR